jgi:hydrogenase-4 component B
VTALAATALIAAGGLWLAAAVLGPLATRPVGLRAVALVSGLGGLATVVGGVTVAAGGVRGQWILGAGNLVGALSLRLEPLAGVFIVLLGVVAVAIAWFAPRYHPTTAGTAVYLCVLQLALLASLMLLVAGNAAVFLVAWESVTLLSYLLILRHHQRQGVARAAFWFVAIGEAGFALLIAAFAILSWKTGTLDLGGIAARAGRIPGGWRSLIFVLALVGFGAKAGLVPLHVWLPMAHPAAPADGSALLSGLVIKLGVFGIALFGFELLGPGRPWWGLLTMGLGALSAVLGILYALMERDLNRLLAYSSIEHVGIIVTAVGASLTFAAYRQRELSAFLLLAALYHVVNHGVCKTLLFLEAGVVEHTAGTRNMDRLGGLAKRLPASSLLAFVGTLGLAALPPLNGFVSEWLIFQGLFQGFRIPSHLVGILIVAAAASLALAGGLAISAFARAFGIPYLGMARGEGAAAASERGQPLAGPALLAASAVALAIGAPVVLDVLDRVVRVTTGVELRPVLLIGKLTVIPAHTDFSSLSPTYLAACLIAMLVVPLAVLRLARPRAPSRTVEVWDGGMVAFRPRMQYTATTYANPVRVTFAGLYQPDVHIERASDDPAGRSGPVHYRTQVLPLFERYLYGPLIRAVTWLGRLVRPIQSGDVNLYLLYVLVAVVIGLLAARR